ncbi:response regulator transcription factor [Kitasatospora sp. NPDC001159]
MPRRATTRTARPCCTSFTQRERDVLRLIAAGLSNSEIAVRKHIGLTTVKTHVSNLMTKADVPNRVRLAVLAIQEGLADD